MSIQKRSSRRFLFRGTASAFSARMREVDGKENLELVPGPPASALTVAGGRSAGSSKGGAYADVFQWKASQTESLGEQLSGGGFRTTVHAVLKGFSARNAPFVFEADEVSASMVAEHRPGKETAFRAELIRFGGSRGLFLEGSPLVVEYDDDLSAFPTFAAFEKAYRSDRQFFERQKARLGAKAKDARFGSKLPRLESGYVETSIVKAIVWQGKTFAGNSLLLKGFGRLFFGEVLLNEYNRRLTMCRLSMGCTVEAEAGLVEVDPNGIWG